MVQHIIKIVEAYNYILPNFLRDKIMAGKINPSKIVLVDYPDNERLNLFLQQSTFLKTYYKRKKEIPILVKKDDVLFWGFPKNNFRYKLEGNSFSNYFENKWKNKIREINGGNSQDCIMYRHQIYCNTGINILTTLKIEELDKLTFTSESLYLKYEELYDKLDNFWKNVIRNRKLISPESGIDKYTKQFNELRYKIYGEDLEVHKKLIDERQNLISEYKKNLIEVENDIRKIIKEIENDEQDLKFQTDNLNKEYDLKKKNDEILLINHIQRLREQVKSESNYFYLNIKDIDEKLKYYERVDINSDQFFDLFKSKKISNAVDKIHLFRNTLSIKLTAIPRFDANFVLLDMLSKSNTFEEYADAESKLIQNYNAVYDFAISSNDNLAIEDLISGKAKRNKLSDVNRKLFTYGYTELPIYSKYVTLRSALVRECNVELLNGFINQNDLKILTDFLLTHKESFQDFKFWKIIFKEQLLDTV